MVKKENCVKQIEFQSFLDSFIVYLKADHIYKDIAETRIGNSNYELDRRMPKGKKKDNWINEKGIRWKNYDKIC